MAKTEQEWQDEVKALKAENADLLNALQTTLDETIKQEKKRNSINIVNVRWFDGYLETFEASEVRFGNAYLWMRLSNGQNRHIPIVQVRWFSLSIESHAKED